MPRCPNRCTPLVFSSISPPSLSPFSVDDLWWLLRSKVTGRVKPTVRSGSSWRALLEGGKGRHGWWLLTMLTYSKCSTSFLALHFAFSHFSATMHMLNRDEKLSDFQGRPQQCESLWNEWSLISRFLILQTSTWKVPRCSHTNRSVEMEGTASPSGTEEVLMCEMCQAVLCVKVIRRWGTCLHGK